MVSLFLKIIPLLLLKDSTFVSPRSMDYPKNMIDLDEDYYTEIAALLDGIKEEMNILKNINHTEEVRNFPRIPLERSVPMLGQITGVSVKKDGTPVIFHRGPVTWDGSSFSEDNHYLHKEWGPISIPTVVSLNPEGGAPKSEWGAGIFYMPHSLTIAPDGTYWMTDVAMHQVFKFEEGKSKPSLVLGTEFTPGNDDTHFCKPTDVAVTTQGDVFVTDGYCNSRVLKFNKDGKKLAQFADNSLSVPHAVTVLESMNLVCVADREHRAVVCYHTGEQEGKIAFRTEDPEMGPVYGLSSHGSLIFGVTSPVGFSAPEPADGFTINAKSGNIVDTWGPNMGFEQPHALAVAPGGEALYVCELHPARLWKFII